MLLKIPATSANLGPGFDCVGMALNLFNYIEFESLEQIGQCEITIKGEGEQQLSKDHSNLVYQAYKKVFSHLNQPVPGIKFELKNNIPLARGLGSSSAAIIGGLLVANCTLANKLSSEEILKLAIELEGHPDNVAPALYGGVVLCSSEKNKVFHKKIIPPSDLNCSVLIPDYELSTKKAREVLPEKIDLRDAIYNIGKFGLLIDALHTGNLEQLRFSMEDKVHQPFRSRLIPGMTEVINRSKTLGALGVAISGAGPSLIIFHKNGEEHLFAELTKILQTNEIDANIYTLKPVSNGALIFDN